MKNKRQKKLKPALGIEYLLRIIWQVENEASGQGCAYCGEGKEQGVCGNCVALSAIESWWEHVGKQQYKSLLEKALT